MMMNINLFFRILSLLTFRKVINFVLLETSYLLSRLFRRPLMLGLPWAVSTEPTTHCNLKCPECPTGMRNLNREGGSMTVSMFGEILKKMGHHLMYITLYFQGEPFLNKDFIEMIRMAKKKKIFVSTSTNGHFLDGNTSKEIVESGLDRLIISLDGTDQSTYEKYRIGGNLMTVIAGIEEIVAWKKKLGKKFPIVEIQFLVLGTNEHQISSIHELASRLKVDKLTLKTAQLYSPDNNPFLTSVSGYSRYSVDPSGTTGIKSTLPNYCHRMWHAPVITWDGKIIPCCFDKDAAYVLGSIQENDFKSTWKSDHYKSFRKKIFHNRKEIPICCNCSEGLKNKSSN